MIDFFITFCTYFLIFSFWSDLVLGFAISDIKGMSIMNAGIYLSIILWCFVIVKRKRFFEKNQIYKYLAFLFGLAVISIPIKMLNPEFTRVRVFSEIMTLKNWAEPFLIFVIFYNLFENKKLCIRSIWALILFLIFCNVILLIDWYDIIDIPGIRKRSYGESSGFGNPNDYAAFVILFLPVLFSTFLFNGKKVIQFTFFISIVISLWAFYLTGSRGGLLAFIAGAFVYIILIKRHIIKSSILKLPRYIMILFLILIIPVFLLPDTFVEDFSGKINPEEFNEIDKYSHGRKTFWLGGLKIFADSPIYGHGLDSFPPLLEKKEGTSATAHNRYLLYLVELGLIGLFSYLILQFSLLKQAYIMLRSLVGQRDKLIFVNYLTGFIGYSIALIFVDGSSSNTYFWIYSAAVCRLTRVGNR